MSKLVDFNLNSYVYVQLTDLGRAELGRQHEELRKTFPNLGEYKLAEEDEEGWSKFQAWVLIRTFGHMISATKKPPFLTDIKIAIGE